MVHIIRVELNDCPHGPQSAPLNSRISVSAGNFAFVDAAEHANPRSDGEWGRRKGKLASIVLWTKS
jgi:hypothetical protein